MLTNINQSHTAGAVPAYRHTAPDADRPAVADDTGGQTAQTDMVSLRGKSVSTATYADGIRLPANDETRFNMLRDLVVNLLRQQGVITITAGDRTIDLAAITPQEAQALVSADGYFGVEQTSERIFQFAVAAAGGDPARIDAIKAGIDKGFAEAKKAFGNWLPDISYDTYDAVMRKLDQWAAPPQTTGA